VSTNDLLGKLVIAVLTYKRTDDLPSLLPMLVAELRTIALQGSVLVVDNDAEASARETVTALALPGVRYVVEPQPGIAAARNRALDESPDDHLLVFIDDDERPEPGWLAAMVDCYLSHDRPVAVAGSVVPDAGRVSDPWITAGEFFVRKRHATGTELDAASTANLLLDLTQVATLGGARFDEKFSLTGGSDTRFTRELTQRGGRIVWCDEAPVIDHIRVSRLTRGWVLQRHFRAGNSWSRTSVDLTPGLVARFALRIRLSVLGLARIVFGGLRSGFGKVTRSMRHRARGSRTVARGAGMFLGAWGATYDEYGRSRKAEDHASDEAG